MAEIFSGPVPVEEDYEGIELNQSNFVLQEDHLEALQACNTPQASSDSYGIDLYENTLSFVYQTIQAHPETYGILESTLDMYIVVKMGYFATFLR